MPTIWLKNIFIVAFFAVQLFMAIPGFLYNKYETEGRFSWNMYSVVYRCRVSYDLIGPHGAHLAINHRGLFNRPKRQIMTLNRDDLPKLNEYICQTIPHQDKGEVIHGSVACKLNYRPPVQFIQQNVNICTAPNYGVLPR